MDKIKPKIQFEDFILKRVAEWRVVLAGVGERCGRLPIRLERGEGKSPQDVYHIVFDAFHRRIADAGEIERLRSENKLLAIWVSDALLESFAPCEICNEKWREEGCE